METENKIGQSICKDFNRIAGDRGVWENHWEEIAARTTPSFSGSFGVAGMYRPAGEKRTSEIFDSTASIALNRFSAILDSLLTPRNQTWHRLMASEPKLNKNREVRLWFEEVNRLLFKYRYAPMANFASQNQQNYKSLGAFGTGCMFIDSLTGNERGLRYRAIHLGEIYFVENHQGIVDQCYRHFPLTARQAVQKYGLDKLPDKMKEAVKNKPDQVFYFIHCVKPREDRDPNRVDYKGMPFVSYHVSREGEHIVEEGGYETFPYAISRYEQAPGEVYGRSPAMDVLPAIKTLNEQKKTMLKQGHRVVDPIYLTHDDGVLDTFSAIPGSIVGGGVSKDGRPLVHTLPVGNIAAGKEMMEEERSLINDSFLVTIFQILVETGNMTATEVLERTKEKGIILAPTIGRQQSEYLGPLIQREISLLAKQRLLPPMPQMLKEAEGEYRLEYDSPMTRAQRAEEASGLMRSIEMTLNVVNVTQNHEPLDHYNWDAIVPEINEIQGVPMRWMNSLEKVQQTRMGRAEQQQEQTAIQGAPAAAAMVKAAAVASKR